MNLRISIVIPVYNGGRTLDDCLVSIFNQTIKRLQIIVVNDGSTDNTKEILNKYKSRLTIINQPNKGSNIARNTGAKISQNHFIIFCDADIVMKPNMMEKMYKTLTTTPEASYVYSSFSFGKKLFKLWPFSKKRLRQMPYIHTTSLIRQEHFPGFDKKLKRFQDWDLWLTMLKRGYVGKFIPEVLFTVKSGGTMSSWLPKFLYKIPFLPKVIKYKKAEKIIKTKHNLQ